jgi:hypothetical protein
MTHHSSTETMSETSTKEIIIFIEKAGKRIFTSKEFFKDIVSVSEVMR